MHTSLYKNRRFLLTILKQLEKSLQTSNIYRPIRFIDTFIFRRTLKSFTIRKTLYFYGNLYEIEEILTITQYFYDKI